MPDQEYGYKNKMSGIETGKNVLNMRRDPTISESHKKMGDFDTTFDNIFGIGGGTYGGVQNNMQNNKPPSFGKTDFSFNMDEEKKRNDTYNKPPIANNKTLNSKKEPKIPSFDFDTSFNGL